MTRPLVSIGIPTYNRANSYLKDALSCAVRQTYPNVEIIVSDNYSNDHTSQVVQEFQDSRIKYFKQAVNIGANNNFNFCVNQARGEYFHLLLDDDLIDDDFIETCMNAAKDETNIGVIRTGTRIVDTCGNVVFERKNSAGGLSTTDFLLAWFSNETTLFLCSSLLNTMALKEAGGFHSKHALFQDAMAIVKLASEHGRLDIRDVKAGFRRHAENMGSAAKVLDWCEDSLELLDIICALNKKDEALLRRAGKPFFCRMNYSYARNIKSPMERYLTYMKVAKFFDHSCSPHSYAYKNDFLPWARSIKRRITGEATQRMSS